VAEQLYTIPLIATPQRFAITLGGRSLVLVNKWNESAGWLIDFYDGLTDDPLIMAMPLVTGINLLGQLEYVGIPGALYVLTDGDLDAVPTQANLGTEANLYYVVDV